MSKNNSPLLGIAVLSACLSTFYAAAGEQSGQLLNQTMSKNTTHIQSISDPAQICGSDDNGQNWQQLQLNAKHQWKKRFNQTFNKTFNQAKASKTLDNTATEDGEGIAGRYYVPVVFHVYGQRYNCTEGDKCLTDEKIINALNQTNQDFQGSNSQDGPIAPQFAAIRASLDVEFVLANKTANGQVTSGIVRHDREQGGYGDSETFNGQVATDSWDNYQYLNVYIMHDLYDNGTLNNSGVAWYPQASMSDQGLARVVYNGDYLGDNTNENFRSVLTHEFGHWLNLPHTFEQKACSLSNESFCSLTGDNSCDTPQMSLASVMKDNAVNCLGQPTNTENFMHYTDNYAMFTQDQVKRMVAALHGPTRESLWSNSNLVAAGLTQYTSNEAHPWDGSGLNQLPEGQLLTSKTGLSGEKDAIDVHAIDIPADTEAVVFYLDGFSQDPDMYVSHGAASVPPSDDNADWQADHISFNSAEQAEFVGLLAPSADEQYFVSVHAFTQYDNANLQVLSVKDTLLCDGCSRLALHKSSQLNASATDEQRTYRFNVPQDAERVVFVIPAGYTGDPDLHISRNKPVSLESFDCRPFSAPQLSEYCEFDLGGTFNVMINPFLDYNNVGLEVYYETKGDTNLLPNALANGSYRGYIDQPLSFSSAGSNDADGTIVSYTWDFGDGNTSTSANPAHSYQSESTYEVSLSVTDDQGATTTDATTAKITLPPLPVIESVCGIQPALEKRQIKVGVTECLPEQHRVSINVSNVKAHNSIAITMNYGQGDADLYFRQGRWPTDTVFHGSSTGQGNNECIYIDDINHEGNFWGYIEVHGAADGASIVVDYDTGGCRTEPLAAQVNGDYSGIVNEDIQFSSDGSFDPQGAISGYKWLFGDGATSKEANPKHNYKVSGEYNVTLTITDDQGNTASASTMAVITLPPAPVLPNSCLTELPSSQGRLTPGKVECLESKTSVGRSVANVDNHQSMAITIDYGQGDATLYYSNGAWPKTTEYQHISNNNGNKECIYIADMGSEAKYWGYILVVGQTEGASIAVDFDTDGCRGSE